MCRSGTGSDGSAAQRQKKRPERVAVVGGQRRRTVAKATTGHHNRNRPFPTFKSVAEGDTSVLRFAFLRFTFLSLARAINWNLIINYQFLIPLHMRVNFMSLILTVWVLFVIVCSIYTNKLGDAL